MADMYLLPPLVRLTSVIASGSSPQLATPTATMGDRGGRGDLIQQLRGNQSPSGHYRAALLLPTPTASDYGSNQGGGAGRVGPVRHSLQGMAQRGLIPTPTASDANGSGSRNTATSKAHPGVSLTDWARGDGGKGRLLPTPGAEDHRNCADYSDGSRGHSPQLRHLGKGRLNPRFVEWMMGFPPDWTALE